MNLCKINQLLSLESIPIYENAVDLGKNII